MTNERKFIDRHGLLSAPHTLVIGPVLKFQLISLNSNVYLQERSENICFRRGGMLILGP